MFQLPVLLLQLCVILTAARCAGWLLGRLHQPRVIGEMAAGLMLGPSLLGWVAPGLSADLFPMPSLGYLNALSQVGVLVFMFMVGLELDPASLSGQGKSAVITSWSSIVAPFALGLALAAFLYPRLGEPLKGFVPFALFMGTAMSITAFPVLARILIERDLLRTRVGALVIVCAAVDDVTAWFILAAVVVLARAGEAALPVWVTALGALAYVAAMLSLARPVLQRLEGWYVRRGELSPDLLATIVILIFASAGITEWLGIHALFGAFLVGAIMPKRQRFVHALADKLESFAVVVLLPLFFAYSGLRASIGLLQGPQLWLYFGLIMATAVVGKWGGSTLAARWTGMSWREATAVGILMNTRGLVELVVLNIGLDLGVISPTLFAMMVLMALGTTFMTSPLLDWVYVHPLQRRQIVDTLPEGAV